jgi:hypothetical protein
MQREREIADGAEMAGLTADTLEKIMATDPVVTISFVDEYGMPWFERDLISDDGVVKHHALGIGKDKGDILVKFNQNVPFTSLVVFVVGILILPTPTHYEWTPPLWAKTLRACLMALAVTAVWAILFRRQVENRRFSVFSILALVAMQAVLMWAIGRVRSY